MYLASYTYIIVQAHTTELCIHTWIRYEQCCPNCGSRGLSFIHYLTSHDCCTDDKVVGDRMSWDRNDTTSRWTWKNLVHEIHFSSLLSLLILWMDLGISLKLYILYLLYGLWHSSLSSSPYWSTSSHRYCIDSEADDDSIRYCWNTPPNLHSAWGDQLGTNITRWWRGCITKLIVALWFLKNIVATTSGPKSNGLMFTWGKSRDKKWWWKVATYWVCVNSLHLKGVEWAWF